VRGYDTIDVDNFGGAAAMVGHLHSLGHTRIAFISGPAGNHDASERLRGYRSAMRSLPGTDGLEIPGDFGEAAGYDACARILRLRRRPTAIFAANDSMAIGLLCAFREAGLRVPEDFAIAGFDDIPIARFITPPLTSVRVPIAELGERATAILLDAVAGGAGHKRRRDVLPTALIVRASCGSVPARFSRVSESKKRLKA
jgi:LacI family transcriptional regulator